MKTNGSHSGHIRVDRQTIETALDDEVASDNEEKVAIMTRNPASNKPQTTTTTTTTTSPRTVYFLADFCPF
jgi:hypothetical protein